LAVQNRGKSKFGTIFQLKNRRKAEPPRLYEQNAAAGLGPRRFSMRKIARTREFGTFFRS